MLYAKLYLQQKAKTFEHNLKFATINCIQNRIGVFSAKFKILTRTQALCPLDLNLRTNQNFEAKWDPLGLGTGQSSEIGSEKKHSTVVYIAFLEKNVCMYFLMKLSTSVLKHQHILSPRVYFYTKQTK